MAARLTNNTVAEVRRRAAAEPLPLTSLLPNSADHPSRAARSPSLGRPKAGPEGSHLRMTERAPRRERAA